MAPPYDRAFIVITKAAKVVKGLPVESSIRSSVYAVICVGAFCEPLAQQQLEHSLDMRPAQSLSL